MPPPEPEAPIAVDRAASGGSPLLQMTLARLKEFYREPEAVFWVYGFPLLLIVALGVAFRSQPIQKLTVDVQAGEAAEAARAALASSPNLEVSIQEEEAARIRLRSGRSDLAVIPQESGEFAYWFDDSQPEGRLARDRADAVLQEGRGRTNPVATEDRLMQESGGRYIDRLVPGLLGMSLMGGGLWGVGFVTVDMRIRKLLKRLVATPMRKGHFLAAIMLSRLLFMIPEVLIMLVFSRVAFGVVNHGSVGAVVALIAIGAFTFSGIGLLVACRAKTIEAVSGMMNLAMLPMWVLSGIFFSSERFPEAAQPVIRILPLTPLIKALRAVMIDGATLVSQAGEIGILAAWGLVTFLLALRWFRWM